jgi:glucosamine--fructose-6-phosphate aminotransferase (isomerizing)
MCGIVGAISTDSAVTRGLVDGLRVLEYRGYDSAGVAVLDPEGVQVRKRRGRLTNLEQALDDGLLDGARAGIGHTRWATHGEPSDANAHPHVGASGRMALVHNGIIENYAVLKEDLLAAGERFTSETDTEVAARLIDKFWRESGDLVGAVRKALARVQGYYAIAILALDEGYPRLIAARHGPPLVVGVTPDGAYLSSDVLAVVPYTKDVVFLEDGDVAVLTPGHMDITSFEGQPIERRSRRIEWNAEDSGKGGFPHYMLKEIHEQPDVLARTTFDRIDINAATCASSTERSTTRSCGASSVCRSSAAARRCTPA